MPKFVILSQAHIHYGVYFSNMKLFLLLAIISCQSCSCFSPTPTHRFRSSCSVGPLNSQEFDDSEPVNRDVEKKGNMFDSIGNFFKELDAFVDDATNRRLGNGWRYYGKRKSSFYGDDDIGKKVDMDVDDPTEDYQGPKKSGYFQWVPDENGQMRPVTRMKKTNIERSPNYWDRVYSSDKEEN